MYERAQQAQADAAGRATASGGDEASSSDEDVVDAEVVDETTSA